MTSAGVRYPGSRQWERRPSNFADRVAGNAHDPVLSWNSVMGAGWSAMLIGAPGPNVRGGSVSSLIARSLTINCSGHARCRDG